MRRPKFEPATLDHGAVHVIYKDHFMIYIQMVMTAEKANKLGHDQVTRSSLFRRRFVE